MPDVTATGKCKICGGPMQKAFSALVLRRHTADFHQCQGCEFLAAEDPYWLDEAYGSSIADSDTGVVQRSLSIAGKLAPLLHFCFDGNVSAIDIGAGYGILVRNMRDLGFDFYWEDKYSPNLFARGFDSSAAPLDRLGLITAFEVMEHVVDPWSFVKDARDRYGVGTFIFTTQLYEGPAPPPQDWWYYGFDIGQHISFYSRKTLAVLADRLEMSFRSTGWFHIFAAEPLRNAWAINFLVSGLGRLLLPYVRHSRIPFTVRDHETMLKKFIGH